MVIACAVGSWIVWSIILAPLTWARLLISRMDSYAQLSAQLRLDGITHQRFETLSWSDIDDLVVFHNHRLVEHVKWLHEVTDSVQVTLGCGRSTVSDDDPVGGGRL